MGQVDSLTDKETVFYMFRLLTLVTCTAAITAGLIYAMDKSTDSSSECTASACSLPSGSDPEGRAQLVVLPEDQWKKRLSKETFRVMRDHGTERPFNNAYWNEKRRGVFVSASTGVPLFSTDDKFDSRTGWPSFTKPLLESDVGEQIDRSFGMKRVEVYSTACGGHLGHVFEDGPPPNGLRYCINSAALKFIPAESGEDLTALAERLREEASLRMASTAD